MQHLHIICFLSLIKVQVSEGIILFYNLKLMTETQQKAKIQAQLTPQEQDPQSADLSDYQFDDEQIQADYQLEQSYVNRIKVQRKRIEDLELLYRTNEQKLRKQQESNRILVEQVNRLASYKEYSSKFSIVSSNLEIAEDENRRMKSQIDDLKQEILQNSSEKSSVVQKLKLELSLQRDRENSKIELLEEELQGKQQQIEQMQRDFKNREKQLLESISGLKARVESMVGQHQNALRLEERKSQKLERELQTRSIGYHEFQANMDSLLKQNSQLKDDVFRLNSYLANRQMELKNLNDRFKVKMNSLKKDIKTKQKECQDVRQQLRKHERETKQSVTQVQTLRLEHRKIKETLQFERSRYQNDFGKEKQRLQIIINQHLASIQELNNLKNELLTENKKLQAILKKKEAVEKQRRQLLKTELKEIDKLEKCIDRIVE